MKLIAVDNLDLAVISSYSQNSRVKMQDIDYCAVKKRIILAIKRYKWEDIAKSEMQLLQKNTPDLNPQNFCDSILHFEKVEYCQLHNLNQQDSQAIFNLLAIRYVSDDGLNLNGQIFLHFDDNSYILLKVECIEARIVDMSS